MHMKPEFDASIFLAAQKHVWEAAVREITDGKKRGHWIWFIFPQLRAIGSSTYSEIYGLSGIADAKSYLKHPVLRARLDRCVRTLTDNHSGRIETVFDPLDAMKVHACLTLFDVAEPHTIFRIALDGCFEGNPHEQTQALITAELKPSLKSKFRQAWHRLVR